MGRVCRKIDFCAFLLSEGMVEDAEKSDEGGLENPKVGDLICGPSLTSLKKRALVIYTRIG